MVARSGPEADGGFGPFFMVRKADGAVMGEIGAGLNGATARVGYTVVEPSWGPRGTPPRPSGPAGRPPGCTGWWPTPSSGTRPAAG
jgi:hypothetical protein